MLIRDFLETRVFQPREHTYMPMDPRSPFAHVLDREGKPKRVMSQGRILVPMAIWDERHENDLIAAMLVQVAEGKGHRAQDYSALDSKLWAKLTHNLVCLILNPDHRGKFEIPRNSKVFYSDKVPLNRIICLGDRNRVGTYLIKDTLRGVFVPHSGGVGSVAIYKPE